MGTIFSDADRQADPSREYENKLAAARAAVRSLVNDPDGIERQAVIHNVQRLVWAAHAGSFANEWWRDELPNGRPIQKERHIPEALMLIVSEIAEAMEGHRKGRADDHLPQYDSLTVELADALIRIFDLAGGVAPRLSEAFVDKLIFNAKRADHKLENRQAPGGKAY